MNLYHLNKHGIGNRSGFGRGTQCEPPPDIFAETECLTVHVWVHKALKWISELKIGQNIQFVVLVLLHIYCQLTKYQFLTRSCIKLISHYFLNMVYTGGNVLRFGLVGDVPLAAQDPYPCSGIIFKNREFFDLVISRKKVTKNTPEIFKI